MKAKIVVLSTALAGMLAAASAVHAVDVKVYPGNGCEAGPRTEAADIRKTIAGITNISAGIQSVLCPIVRDNHTNLNGVKGVVRARSDSEKRVRSDGVAILDCTLVSFTDLGDVVASDSNSTTLSALGTVTKLPLDINTSTKGGTYGLECILPPAGEVLGYRVEEF